MNVFVSDFHPVRQCDRRAATKTLCGEPALMPYLVRVFSSTSFLCRKRRQAGSSLPHKASSLHCLAPAPCHFTGKRLFAVLPDISDTSRTVRFEKKCENLSDKIRIRLASCHLHAAFGTRTKTVLPYTFADFTPRRLFIGTTPRASPCKVLPASPAIKTAGCY